MSLSLDDVNRIAVLARIELEKDEAAAALGDYRISLE